LTPGAPISVAWVEAGSVAGFGRAGEFGGMLMVSLAADTRAAAPRSERKEKRCMLEASCQDRFASNIKVAGYRCMLRYSGVGRCNVGGSVA
jgi:hypothetical protein